MKKIRLYIISVTTLLSIFSISLYAQTITGYVKSGPTGEPLAGVNCIAVQGEARGAMTDGSGRYTINGTVGVPITLICTQIGYSSIYRTITPVTGTNNLGFWFDRPILPSASISGSKTVCRDASSVHITLSVANGEPPFIFTYRINGGADQSISTTNNSIDIPVHIDIPGMISYSLVSLMDLYSTVSASGEATVTVLSELNQPNVSTVVQPTCAVGTGSVLLTGLPSTGIWTLTRNPGGVTSSGSGGSTTISGLNPGSYTFTVSDEGGCISGSSSPVIINAQPLMPAAPVVGTITQPTCTVATGSVALTGLPAPGGWTLTRFPEGTTYTGSGTATVISGLAEGTYNFTLTNSAGCVSPLSGSIVINAQPETPPAPTISEGGPTTICEGGIVMLTSSIGTSYLWSTGATTQSINVTAPGSYTVRVTNAAGCQSEVSPATVVTVNPLPAATIGSASITNLLCSGSSTGSIDLIVSGGTPGYLYQWSNGSTTEDLINIPAGNYSALVTDANGCTATANATVTEPPIISITPSITFVSCNSCKDGAIRITAAGGTGGYSYAWTGPDGFTSTTKDIAGLKPGIYNLTIMDANNCTGSFNYEVVNPFIVTNVTDAGFGSLRYALDYSNSTSGIRDTITFNIPGNGPFSIQPALPFPEITDPVVIDGYSQPGSSATTSKLMIELDGTIAGPGVSCLMIRNGYSKITGLVINRFQTGINITSDGNIIAGNFIGTDILGQSGMMPNGSYWTGIIINGGSNNRIGGEEITDRNVVSGNYRGIYLINSNKNNITGNYIGVDASGKKAVGNKLNGILLYNSSYCQIGSNIPGGRNIISSNSSGIGISANSESNLIIGNFIGTDESGTSPLGNTGTGINIYDESSFNIIGGVNQGEGNVISGNSVGIWINGMGPNVGPASNSNKIIGNFIGTDYTGVTAMGNKDCGVLIANGTFNNQIGGDAKGFGNIIANSPKYGVWVFGENGDDPFNNSISCNSIYNNRRIGIDLGTIREYDGVTLNDEGDGDSGPNNFQNFPVLDTVKFDIGNKTVSVKGSLSSTPGSVYSLEFFANKISDSTGYGEGQKYLGTIKVITGADGKANFNQSFPHYGSWGDIISSTATDAQGNTSEFSRNIGGLQRQVIAYNSWPFYYTVNSEGISRITDGSDISAIESSFSSWASIPTARISFLKAGTTTSKYASSTDGVNLVTCVDDRFPFPPGVLAVAAKTLRVVPGNDAEIIDADIVVNPAYSKNDVGVGYSGSNAGYFDLQSVVTHEIGHVLGLLHSGVYSSTMFYMMGKGIDFRTLEQDDKSWASYKYPGAMYNYTYGVISGNIKYGYDETLPVAGTLVLAINTVTHDTVHAYSDASGDYIIPGLRPGVYNVFIEPLNGSANVHRLKPANISSYIYCNTVYTDYPGEFYSNPESKTDADEIIKPVTVSLDGTAPPRVNFVTNIDNAGPELLTVSPVNGSSGFDINRDIIVTFSEAVDIKSLTDETCYLEMVDPVSGIRKHGLSYLPLGNASNIIMLTPDSALQYSANYVLHYTTGIKDLRNNPLANPGQSTFGTIGFDGISPEITDTYPLNNADSVFVMDKVTLFFSEPMNKSSVENNFTLSWSDEGIPPVISRVDGSFTWDKENKTMIFIPLKPLREGERYTISVSDKAVDLGGMSLNPGKTYYFKTVPEAAPIIIYLGPENGQTGTTVNTPVVADFSEPVNPNTVTSESFGLYQLDGTLNIIKQITGSYEFLNQNSRVVFRPDAGLLYSTNYSIKIKAGIEDVSDQVLKLKADTLAKFKTSESPQTVHLTYIDPPAGAIGSVVTIGGTGFDPDPAKNTIKFNGVSGVIKSSSLTTLTTEVPLGAVTGSVTVTGINGLTADNQMSFYVIPQSYNPCESITASSSVGTKSTGGAALAGDALAFVTNPLDDKVTVVYLKPVANPVDPKNPTIAGVISVGDMPLKIDINPQGTLAYVTNFLSNDVSVIDIKTLEVVETIKVGIQPYGVAVTPDGKRVYVANYYSGDLSVIDVDPNSGGFDHVVANVTTGTKTKDVEVTADAGLVLVTGDFGLKIFNGNPNDENYNSAIANVASGTKIKEVEVTADASLAILTTEDNNLLVVNLHPENGDYNNDAIVANVPAGTKVSEVRVSGDAMFVYVSAPDAGQILVYKIGYGSSGTPNGSGSGSFTLTKHSTIGGVQNPDAVLIDASALNLYVVEDGTDGYRAVTTIVLCCGPVDPAKAIGDMISNILNMINSGEIKLAIGNDLIFRLNEVLRNLADGKSKTAINNLNAVVVKLNDLIKSRQITKAQGQPLIDATNTLIAQIKKLSGIKSATADLGIGQLQTETIKVSDILTVYPNPSSSFFTINYEISELDEELGRVSIRVIDLNGNMVCTLVDRTMQAGEYTVDWNGANDNGLRAPTGNYMILFRTGTVEKIKMVILIK